MGNALLTKWTGPAFELAEPLDRIPMPIHVLSGEAVDVARFFESHWKAQKDPSGKVTKPGLELAARDGLFNEQLGSDILELQEAMQAAQTHYLLTAQAPGELPTKRAEFVLRELQATLEYMFDDGIEDVEDARLERLAEAHQNASSQDALAAALDDYSGLAEVHRQKLEGLGGFDTRLIDEAKELAKQLRERSADKLTNASTIAQKQALDLRNRLATLLYRRINTVRAATRFVFRNNPDIVRKATSTYQRSKTSRYRRANAQEKASEPSKTVG
jgi:hypothetical protein